MGKLVHYKDVTIGEIAVSVEEGAGVLMSLEGDFKTLQQAHKVRVHQ